MEERAFVGTYRSLSKGDRALRMKNEDEKIRECCGASLRRPYLEGEELSITYGVLGYEGPKKGS